MISDVVVILTTLLALFLPGLAVGWSLGLRPSTVLAVAPALTFGLVTAAGSVASAVEFPWTPLTFAVGTLAAAGLVLLVRAAWRRRRPESGRPLLPRLQRPGLGDLAIGGGVVLGWLVSAFVLVRGYGGFDRPNQDWDYVFHSNALRLIADRQDVAPAALRAINDWEVQSSFYPNAFHALGALVRDLTGAPVFAVLNALTLTIAGVAGLGLAALLRSLRAPVVVSASTPVLLAGFGMFPYDVLSRGPLLPYSMGVALIPAFFVVLLEALRRRSLAGAVGTGLAAAALLGVQTSAALSAALIAVPLLVQRWAPKGRQVWRDLRGLAGVGVVAVAVGWAYALGALSMSAGGPRVNWPAVETVGQATGDLLLLNHAAAAPQYWLAGLLALGLLSLRSTGYMAWWLAGGGFSVALFVLAASSDSQRVEDVTSPWWNDRYRFAAVAVLAFAPLAAHGLFVLARAVAGFLARHGWASQWQRQRLAAIATLGLIGVVVLSHGLYLTPNEAKIAYEFQDDRQLSPTEVTAMRWLASQPGVDGQVMNDPNDGSPYMSALFGLHPVFGHIMPEGSAPGRVQRLLLDHFNCLDSDPELRAAVSRLHIRYLYLAGGYVRTNISRMRGLLDMSSVRSVKLVYREPGVLIYKIDLTAEATAPSGSCSPDADR